MAEVNGLPNCYRCGKQPCECRDRGTLYLGDALEVLSALPAGVVQCCVTSPPYFALRSYLDKDDPLKAREIGSEPTPEAFIATMVAVFREVRRVLRDDGVCFVNLGDSYDCGTNKGRRIDTSANKNHGYWLNADIDRRIVTGIGASQLLNIPHRVAEALRADGWVWRQTIVWAKRCLSGGTWLYARTQKGDAPAMLKDLVRLDPSTVKLWDGQRWTQVLGWTRTPTVRGSRRKNAARQYLEVVLRSGEHIGCTAEHRWPTDRGLVFASDLKPGDVIKTCRLPPPASVQPLCLPDREFGWLAGFYLAEGCRTEKGVNFSIHADETEAYLKIKRLAELVGGTASYRKRHGKSAVVVVYSQTLKAFLAEYVTAGDCHTKRLDRKAWMRGNAFLGAILGGYLEGDGHWDRKAGRWRLGFCNNDGLAVDLRCLCARLGKICVLTRAQHTYQGKVFPGWRGTIRESSSHYNARPMGEVVEIRNSRAREFWDIAVADEPNLFALASGVLSHNSPMPESVSGWQWVRCRVKVAGQKRDTTKIGEAEREYRASLQHPDNGIKIENAKWSPCPGCPKCEPHGGYVLRRGAGRCTTAHEYIFVFTKSNRYFWDGEGSKERATSASGGACFGKISHGELPRRGIEGNGRTITAEENMAIRDGSRNPRSVWTLSSEPTKVRHFATFPSELVRLCLVAGCSAWGCCPTCGAPWAPVVDSERVPTRPAMANKIWKHADGDLVGQRSDASPNLDPQRHIAVTGCRSYRQTCECPSHDPAAQRVLDPFCGIGTTGQTALHLGHAFIGIDLNSKYLDVAATRITEMPRWRLRQVAKAGGKKVAANRLHQEVLF